MSQNKSELNTSSSHSPNARKYDAKAKHTLWGLMWLWQKPSVVPWSSSVHAGSVLRGQMKSVLIHYTHGVPTGQFHDLGSPWSYLKHFRAKHKWKSTNWAFLGKSNLYSEMKLFSITGRKIIFLLKKMTIICSYQGPFSLTSLIW